MAPIRVRIGAAEIVSKSLMNVLGVLLDSELNWPEQVSQAVFKSNKSLNAIKIIRRFFGSSELLQLLTSNYYSVFFYNSETWNSPNLNHQSKQVLLSVSVKALRFVLHYPDKYFLR